MQIVIVDSSRVVLQIIASQLEPRGHGVHPFTDSRAALAFITNTPDVRVLITSLDVRPLSGLELCASARMLADEHRPLHVITMSSAGKVRNLAEALDSGADDFIEKPPGAEELQARVRVAERLTTMQAELIRLAETDPLTGLNNRRAFFARADAAIGRIGAEGQVSVVLIDIDHFKSINDRHGHDVGDNAIRAVAALMKARGIAGRLGGEEFGIVLPGVGAEGALAHAEDLRRQAAALRVPAGEAAIGLTCSFGVSARVGSDAIAALVKRADMALYRAKSKGRNQVVCLDGYVPAHRAG